MNAEQLSKVGSDLVRRCGTRDPFQIANALGINVMDDCENLGSLKGICDALNDFGHREQIVDHFDLLTSLYRIQAAGAILLPFSWLKKTTSPAGGSKKL